MLLTFSATPTKGSTVTVDFDPYWLLNYNAVLIDPYWSDLTNTKIVVVTFSSEEGDQDFRLRYDVSNLAFSAEMSISLKARSGIVSISRIIMVDFDNGELILARQQVTDADDYSFTLT
jgi:hypothetical protein